MFIARITTLTCLTTKCTNVMRSGKTRRMSQMTFWEMAWNSEKTSIWQYSTTQHHLIRTLDVDVFERKFKQFWKELTCSFQMRSKTQFWILQHPTGFYRSHHKCKCQLKVKFAIIWCLVGTTDVHQSANLKEKIPYQNTNIISLKHAVPKKSNVF